MAMFNQQNDIFKATRVVGDAWRIDGAVLTFGGDEDSAQNKQLIATGANLTYQRSLTPIMPINSSKTYMIAGQPMGSLTIASLVGPQTDLKAFMAEYADVCNLGKKTVMLKPAGLRGCESADTGKDFTLYLSGVLLSSLGVQVQEMGQGNLAVAANITMTVLKVSFNG
jgi:hypothetical protein